MDGEYRAIEAVKMDGEYRAIEATHQALRNRVRSYSITITRNTAEKPLQNDLLFSLVQPAKPAAAHPLLPLFALRLVARSQNQCKG